MTLVTFAIGVGSYLIGSFPTGVWLGRLATVDLQRTGSGNTGATNVARALGPALGVLTLLLDTAKGWLPVFLAQTLAPQSDPLHSISDPAIIAAAAAVAGHMYSPALGFRGGKGVATTLGAILALAPGVLLLPLLLFAFLVGITRQVSLGSVSAAFSCAIAAQISGYPAGLVVLLSLLGAAIILRHGENLVRLRNGTEPTI